MPRMTIIRRHVSPEQNTTDVPLGAWTGTYDQYLRLLDLLSNAAKTDATGRTTYTVETDA